MNINADKKNNFMCNDGLICQAEIGVPFLFYHKFHASQVRSVDLAKR